MESHPALRHRVDSSRRPSLALCRHLVELGLNGTVPNPGWELLSTLRTLDFSFNALHGSIDPYWRLSSSTLQTLVLVSHCSCRAGAITNDLPKPLEGFSSHGASRTRTGANGLMWLMG